MNRIRLVVGSLCSVAALSCAADESEPGGYVLLDLEARQAGVSVEVGDHVVASALPIAVAPGEHVAVHAGSSEEAVTVGRGELVYVEGTGARVSHLQLGKQVARDELRLTGEEEAANDLAGQLGAKVARDGAGWRVGTPEVFSAAAFAHVPERLLGAAPVMLSEADRAPTAAAGGVARTAGAVPVARKPVTPVTPLASEVAGVPADPEPSAGRPAAVSFIPAANTCTGVAGQWRGRVYSDWHGAYYDFTLTVEQDGAALKGTVVAEFWDGATDEVEPPDACGQVPKQHVKVVEAASGSLADGTMRFASTSWRVGSHLCGERVTDYSLDRFVVPLADGATSSHAVASDDVVWVSGLPVDLTRVSCP
jgi:hypothetical protein